MNNPMTEEQAMDESTITVSALDERREVAAAREFCRIQAGQCCVKEDDLWARHGDDFRNEAKRILAAADEAARNDRHALSELARKFIASAAVSAPPAPQQPAPQEAAKQEEPTADEMLDWMEANWAAWMGGNEPFMFAGTDFGNRISIYAPSLREAVRIAMGAEPSSNDQQEANRG